MKTTNSKSLERSYILTGTVTKRFGKCGKEGCRCSQDKGEWHGPYYIWTRKENGKTITKSLSPTQARVCKKALKNMKKLKIQIEKWKRQSVKFIQNKS